MDSDIQYNETEDVHSAVDVKTFILANAKWANPASSLPPKALGIDRDLLLVLASSASHMKLWPTGRHRGQRHPSEAPCTCMSWVGARLAQSSGGLHE